MYQQNITFILSIWGAFLSTGLFIRILYLNRIRIRAHLNSDMDSHTLIISNRSEKETIIKGFSLFWKKGFEITEINLDYQDFSCFSIKSNGYVERKFEEQYYFHRKANSKLYILIGAVFSMHLVILKDTTGNSFVKLK